MNRTCFVPSNVVAVETAIGARPFESEFSGISPKNCIEQSQRREPKREPQQDVNRDVSQNET